MRFITTSSRAAIALAVIVAAGTARAWSDARREVASLPARNETIYLPPCPTNDPDVCSRTAFVLPR